ncbi:MAG: carboxymuconolactone decarboxylase family protein [Alphaproteobacteria bacterium]
MPRLQPLPDDALGPLADTLAGMEATMGYVPNSFKTMGRKPEMAQALLAWAGTVMAPGTVNPELKNMVSQVTSKSAGCAYCMAHTGHSAHGAGISAEKEAALWDWETSPLFTDAERVALRVAQGAAQVPNAVTDADFADLKQHFTDDQIVEIVAVISMFGFFNRWNDTMATELESSPLRFAQDTLGPKGWDAGKHG